MNDRIMRTVEMSFRAYFLFHTAMAVIFSSATADAFTTYIENKSEKKKQSTVWVGPVVGCLLFLGICIIIGYCYIKMRQKKRAKQAQEHINRNTIRLAVIPLPAYAADADSLTPGAPGTPSAPPAYEEVQTRQEGDMEDSPPAYSP